MNESPEGFLSQIAKSLYQRFGGKINEVTIVFPNRRAGLYFSEYLNQLITTPSFAPEILTIKEFFANLTALHQEDDLLLIFRLFKKYKELSGSTESFDEFYLWGEMLLHDFDQVDKYLVDAELLFTNITDLKEIDAYFNDWNVERREEISHFWSSLQGETSKRNQKEFSRLWQILFPLYKFFKEELQQDMIAYEGMIYRDVIESKAIDNNPFIHERQFVIAGFNALNACEKELFKTLLSNLKVSFYWDYDHYYLDDPDQEAALFMRENLNMFPQPEVPYDIDNFRKKKEIQIVATSSQIGQTQIAASKLIKNENIKVNFDESAIVLCEEDLLLPMLSAIPSKFGNINVTMGLPLRQTPLFDLIMQMAIVQKRAKQSDGKVLFHYKSVVDLLNNQLIQTLYSVDSKLIVDKILQNNLIYISAAEVGVNELFIKVFKLSESVAVLPEYFLSVIYDLFIAWEDKDNSDVGGNYLEHLYLAYVSINKLNGLLFSEGLKIMGSKEYLSVETFFKLLIQYLGSINISYEGEPLSGLQIMGILETRTLDFKQVILLSVNEGIMPKANTSGSFIPYHLRKGVGLPTIEEQSAMYAYYFYRLLQRAEKVTIIYNSGSNGLKTGEKSRFIHQLILESGISIEESTIQNTIDPLPVKVIKVEKRGVVLEKLNHFIETGRRISPSALDLYLQCPLSYYFKYIAQFEEEDEIAEEVDAKIFGKIFHAVMESLYQPWLGRQINHADLEQMLDNDQIITSNIRKAFANQFFKMSLADDEINLSGRNVLVFEVIHKMVVQTIRFDLAKTPFEVVGLEKGVAANLPIFNNARGIRLGGFIDRIDLRDGLIEIIDYKTGSTDLTISSIADLFDQSLVKRNKAAFQTLVYCFIWDSLNENSLPIYPSIYELKKIFQLKNSRLLLKESNSSEVNYQNVKSEFVPRLTALIEEIFNPDYPFQQTEIKEHCQYCSFASLCGKTFG